MEQGGSRWCGTSADARSSLKSRLWRFDLAILCTFTLPGVVVMGLTVMLLLGHDVERESNA
jgi:hypothetical protein